MPLKPMHAVVLSRPAGSWGADMGANDHSVSIGCSQLQTSDDITAGLTAHDVVRLVVMHFKLFQFLLTFLAVFFVV